MLLISLLLRQLHNKCKIDRCDLFVAIITTKYKGLCDCNWNYFVNLSITTYLMTNL